MNLPIPVIGSKRRVRRQRRTPPPTATPAAVTIVAVVELDALHAVWQFSSPVVSFTDYSGLKVNGQTPSGSDGTTSEGWLVIEYPSDINIDDPWEVSGGAEMVFESGGELQVPESGNVT